jgi:hypothetical protein
MALVIACFWPFHHDHSLSIDRLHSLLRAAPLSPLIHRPIASSLLLLLLLIFLLSNDESKRLCSPAFYPLGVPLSSLDLQDLAPRQRDSTNAWLALVVELARTLSSFAR